MNISVWQVIAIILIIIFIVIVLYLACLGVSYISFDKDKCNDFIDRSRRYALKNGIQDYGYVSLRKLQKEIVKYITDDNYNYEIDSNHYIIRIFDKKTKGQDFLIALQGQLIIFNKKIILMHTISYYYYVDWFNSVMLSMDIRGDTMQKKRNILKI